MSSLTVDVLGTAVGIAAPGPVQDELRRFLADLEPAAQPAREVALTPSDHGFDLRDSGHLVRTGVAPGLAAATIVWRLNAIAVASTDHVSLHGGCVAGPLGAGVLLVGGSGAGKTTLVSACVRAGLAYLSDELAAIDRRTGRLASYARPLGLDGECLVPASELGTVAASASPAAVVFPRYRPGTDASVVQLDPGWALAALAAHATNLAALRGTALAWLASLAVACPAYQLTHGDSSQAVETVGRLASGRARPLKPSKALDPVTSDTTTVAVGESLAVLHEPSGRVHVLNPDAAHVWRHAVGALAGRGTSSPGDDERRDPLNGDDSDPSAADATAAQLGRLGLLTPSSCP
jgi:hypothetical protein